MSLISGKEALIALANGEAVQFLCNIGWCDIDNWEDWDIKQFTINNGEYKFRIKPQAITINGIEVPAPFEPKEGDYVYVISDQAENGWIKTKHDYDFGYVFGAWRTEEEIKQVVEALQQIFK